VPPGLRQAAIFLAVFFVFLTGFCMVSFGDGVFHSGVKV